MDRIVDDRDWATETDVQEQVRAWLDDLVAESREARVHVRELKARIAYLEAQVAALTPSQEPEHDR